MPTLTVYPYIDSIMDYLTASSNYGSAINVSEGVDYLGGSKSFLMHAIGNFDVNPLAGRTINTAKLVREIYGYAGSGVQAKLSRCTRPATWTEGGVTWNKYDGVNNWTAGGGDVDDTTPGVVTFNLPTANGTHEITGLAGYITDALANRAGIASLHIRLSNEDPGTDQYVTYYSRDHGTDGWRLVIDYTGALAGIRRERYFGRGLLRGVMRGVR